MTLGILDWGIGGCGLYNSIQQKSDIECIYLSDSGFTPYGKLSRSVLRSRVLECIHFLKSKGATKIAIACNAAGSVFFEDSSYYNVVHFSIRLLENNTQSTALIGGYATIESGIFKENEHLTLRVAQPLSAHIEAGCPDEAALQHDLKTILAPVQHVDRLILACTHYPAIKHKIANHMHSNCSILDPIDFMSEFILKDKPSCPRKSADDQWFTTGNINATKNAARLAFNVDIRKLSKISI